MSVLLGLYSKSGPLADEVVRPVFQEFEHDGSRELVTHRDERLLLSHARSPRELGQSRIVEDAKRSQVLLFGGELFHFEEKAEVLRTRGRPLGDPCNQAELLLKGFDEFGTPFFEDLVGAFAFARYDRCRDELVLANDPFGMHPLFVLDTEDHCVFASEYEPLTRLPGFRRELDLDAVAEYFTLSAPLGEKTFFRGIRNLRPGSMLHVGRPSERRNYCDLAIAVDREHDLDWFADRAGEILKRAVRARLEPRERATCALSGGMDTRLILACIPPDQRDKVLFRTFRSDALAEDEDRDVIIARRIAGALSLNHEIRRWGGSPSVSDVDASFLARSRRLRGSVFKFEGFCGADFLGGSANKLPLAVQLRESTSEGLRARLRALFASEVVSALADPRETLDREIGHLKAERSDFLLLIHYECRGFFTTIAGGSRNGWVMPYRHLAHNQDAIFRDTGLLRFLLTVPRELLADRALYDRVFQVHFPDLCKIPTTRSCRAAPFMTEGRTAESARRQSFTRLLADYRRSDLTWEKGLYERASVERMLVNEDHPIVPSFVDFESWYRERFLAGVSRRRTGGISGTPRVR